MFGQTTTRFPISYQQGRAWRGQLTGGARRATCWVEISGSLDPGRLRECIRGIVKACEILRTSFVLDRDSGIRSQIVHSEPDFVWTHKNLQDVEPSGRNQRLQRWIDRQVDCGDPAAEPPLRAFLATFAAESHALLLSLPALCADAVSMERLANLIASSNAGDFTDPESVFQYGDFATWQRELLTQEDTRAGSDFWEAYSRRIEAQSWGRAWPSSFDATPGNRFQTCAPDLDPSLVQRIDAFSSQQDIPGSTLLLTCWQVLLARISQLPEQLISVQCAGRNYPEFENAIGAFARWIPLQLRSEGSTLFARHVGDVQRVLKEVESWQQSFCGLAESGSSPNPAPEVGFDYLDLPAEQDSGETVFRAIQVSGGGEDFVLRLSVTRQEKHLRLKFHFDATRLNRETVEEWVESYTTLLAVALRNPQLAINRLPVLSQAQRHRLLVEWNQTVVDYPRTRCMQELIEEQAARTPECIAVRCQDRTLTYQELNEQSNQLAHWLRGRGVGPDQRVGLCMDRSLETVVGILGILKAGGAYVPLNAEHPPARLAQQLEGAVALVTELKSLERTAGFAGAVVCLDRDRTVLRNLPRTNPKLETTPENLVYVLFTSGSTGMPKGVAVRHRNLVNYTWFARDLLGLEKYPKGLQFAMVSTVCADVGITCIYPALTSGGCLHVIPYDVATDSARYGEYATREKIDVLKIVPSHLAALLSADGGRAVLPRKYVVVGGERLTRDLMEKITVDGVGCEVVNHYAPTETTCGSLTLKLSTFDWRNWQGASIPLGRPIANTRLYVLDAEGEPVPVGARGELYIAGDGVSAGYAGDPQRTEERFLPDRFVPGAIMYRSGDIVRYLADGNIEFLERVDDQVKIRGFRVELGEAQAVLQAHPAVKQAMVLARAGQNGDRRLLGWAVVRDGVSLTGEELREHVKRQLPDYMVPSRVMILPRFPLTRNGKIDRQGLPEPEDCVAPVAPQTAMEQAVAAIWREVLEREHIGTEQNFFDVGGHSLLATQIVARLRKRLKLSVPVRAIFDHPTVAELAKAIEKVQQEELVAPPIRPVPRNGCLPLSFGQEALWIRDQFEPHSALYNIPRAWRLKGPLHRAALQKSLDEIVRRHESQRTTFGLRDGKPVQIVAKALHIPIANYDLNALSAEETDEAARRIVEDESQRPFDLERGPLLRACLVQLAEEDHILLLVFHHIISDAWSAGVFFTELKALYAAFSQGGSSPLPPVELQYGDYAVHEREWLQGKVLQTYVDYWRKELADAPPLLTLPADRPRSSARSFGGRYETVRLTREISKAVQQFSREQSTTPFTVLMSAFQALLWSYSGQPQIVVGTDVANRNTPEVEGILGFFVNVLPIRTDFSGDPTFRDLLGRVQQRLLGAYAHQQLPFAKIVQEIQPERSNSHNPIVQALFVFQNTPYTEQSLSGLQVESYSMPLTSSKFDLAVFMAVDGDELVGYWVYSTDLFEQSTILQMSGYFETLVEKLIHNPNVPLSKLDFPHQETCPRTWNDSWDVPLPEATPTFVAAVAQSEAANGHGTRTPMEDSIAAIWREVLQRADIGADENLFEIGGHSLIATQIAARLRSRLGLAVYVRTIFDHPTIRDLARAVDEGRDSVDNSECEILQVPRMAVRE